MKHLLRRWFHCRHGQHRETLDMRLLESIRLPLIAHDFTWVCVDCGKQRWFNLSDNTKELRKEGRIA